MGSSSIQEASRTTSFTYCCSKELEKELTIRKTLEGQFNAMTQEKAELLVALENSKGSASEYMEKQAKLITQKADFESQIADLSSKLQSEEEARMKLTQDKKKGENESFNLKKDIEDMELTIQKAEG